MTQSSVRRLLTRFGKSAAGEKDTGERTDPNRRILDFAVHPPFPGAKPYRWLDFLEFQRLYMVQEERRLIPSTEVWFTNIDTGERVLAIEVNSLGCKGPEIDPTSPTVVCYGDSTTMGLGTDSWPFHMDLPCQVLNAAAEGADMAGMVRRHHELSSDVNIVGAIVYVGWHNLIYNYHEEDYWDSQLRQFLGTQHWTAFCTIGTCLIDDFRERGIRQLMDTRVEADLEGEYFNFWAHLDPDDWLVPLIEAIDAYNTFVMRFAKEHGATLIDLRSFLAPSNYENATRDFFDVCHLRPQAYEPVGQYVSSVIRNAFGLRATGSTVATRQLLSATGVISAMQDPEYKRQMYPLW